MKLTKEQQTIVEDNMGLFWNYVYNNKYVRDDEDIVGDLLEEFCKIVPTWNPNNNKLSTYLYRCLDNRLKEIYTYRDRLIRKKPDEISIVYLDSMVVKGSQDPVSDSMHSQICENKNQYDELETFDLIERVKKILNQKNNKNVKVKYIDVYTYTLAGYNNEEIAKKFNTTRQRVNSMLQDIRKIVLKEMEK